MTMTRRNKKEITKHMNAIRMSEGAMAFVIKGHKIYWMKLKNKTKQNN
jgi:hypothetical protein